MLPTRQVISLDAEFALVSECILYFPIPHNILCFSSMYCCEMLLGGLLIPKGISQL